MIMNRNNFRNLKIIIKKKKEKDDAKWINSIGLTMQSMD